MTALDLTRDAPSLRLPLHEEPSWRTSIRLALRELGTRLDDPEAGRCLFEFAADWPGDGDPELAARRFASLYPRGHEANSFALARATAVAVALTVARPRHPTKPPTLALILRVAGDTGSAGLRNLLGPWLERVATTRLYSATSLSLSPALLSAGGA